MIMKARDAHHFVPVPGYQEGNFHPFGVGGHAFKVRFSPLCQFRWCYLVCLLCFHHAKIKLSITIRYCVLWLEFSCPPSRQILLPMPLFNMSIHQRNREKLDFKKQTTKQVCSWNIDDGPLLIL